MQSLSPRETKSLAQEHTLSGWTEKKLPSTAMTSEKHAQQINEMHRKRQCLQLALANRKGSVLLHDHIQQHVT